MYTDIHTSLIRLFPHSYQLCSVSLQLHFPPHLDDFIFDLKSVAYIEYFIIFSSCIYDVMFAYMLSLLFFGICSLVLFLSVICHVFQFLSHVFHCTNFMFLQVIFQVFQLTFSFLHDNVDMYTMTW